MTFEYDTRKLSSRVWFVLGQIHAKIEQISSSTVHPDVQRELDAVYLAKGAQATTAIEGNTLTEEQVRQSMENELDLPPSQEYQEQAVRNVIEGYKVVDEWIFRDKDELLSTEKLMRLNGLVLQDLEVEEGVLKGELRRHPVGVANYRGAPAEDCEYLSDRLCEWTNSEMPRSEEDRIYNAVLRAILAHLYIAWIHPFGDGNGRTARLIEYQVLVAASVPRISAHLMSNHYNKTRDMYYLRLAESSKVKDATPFIGYAIQGFLDGLNAQVERIAVSQSEIMWRDFVYDSFRKNKGEAAGRRRSLAIELIKHNVVRTTQIPGLNHDLTRSYMGKTRKTISRDVNELRKRGLILKAGILIRANRDLLRVYKPQVHSPQDWSER